MSAEQRQLERNEEARRTVMAYLAQRSSVAQLPATITQRLRVEHDFSLDEVTGALSYLQSDGMVDLVRSEFGVSRSYQATAKGIRAWEETQV